MRKALSIVGAGLAAVLLGASFAWASIPDAQGTIHGCYQNTTGNLKVIDNAVESCPSGYTSLNWNQTGPPGISGYTTASQVYDIPAGYSSPVLNMSVACPLATQKPLSGGFDSNASVPWAPSRSIPVIPGPGGGNAAWAVQLVRLGDIVSNQSATVFVVCANVS